MRRAVIIAALLLVTPFLVGLKGPEPPSSPDEFAIILEETTQPVTVYDRWDFSRSLDGWDFEDRDGYECANIALYGRNGTLLLLVDIEQSKDYLTGVDGGTFRINDRGGVEPGDAANPDAPSRNCGNETHGPPTNSRWVPSGEDHFPHFHSGANSMTHGLDFRTSRGRRAAEILERGELSLMREIVNGPCDRMYPTPGDEPGEVVLWWDEDFPENGHSDGTEPLDCGGGGGEPIAVARIFFARMAANVQVCILDHDAQVCIGTLT